MDSAALYLRSSKDRHDISPDAQRRELMELAKARSLAVVETFQDAVESGKDDQRPGFQALLRRLKDPARAWTHLLALDTSRIARNQYLAHALHYECEKRGVKISYAKMPETNTVMDVVIRAVMQAFDELHSLMSKEKGLSGMAENVRQGWRAGGRAPMGYRLEHIGTGAIRDGSPVTKSRLVPSADAGRVKSYLKARADGTSRTAAATGNGLEKVLDSTLIGMEWNSLTYAGHTVWNVHAERIPGGGYKGGAKRRPRKDWVVQHDTHEALITTEEAESILARLDTGRSRQYRTAGAYLLSGLLVVPDGRKWHGNGDGYYRSPTGKRQAREAIEQAVVGQVAADLVSDTFVTELVKEARRMSAPPADAEIKPLRDQINAITVKIGRLADMAAESETPRPFMAQIEVVEKQREKLAEELNRKEADQKSAEVLRAITAKDVRDILAGLTDNLNTVNREALKEYLHAFVDKIELCPTTGACRIHYRIGTGDLMASPRRTQEIPALRVVSAILRLS